ncbi:Exopolysaccharide production protein ExoZ [Caballeronia glathei]|uniref:Acyltransferase 3 domain-containing protein n=1 Tax=Caballeronia glathei TaxID=60547 RepID=A0A069PH50_9BURK|nr:acyltransferase [Caballeronia glathei]KDR39194.1 hypothetical protein BG61_34110 [Caballeronia glathei]CDY76093.1 Exopolysaccharide production protein ExoZ [Caballeronia glathei]
MTKTRLDGLQSLRGIAALAVLVQHINFYVCSAKQVDYHHSLPIDLGSIGVEIFFVISGFVMAGCMSQGKAFIWNRALRIYPGFWLAIVVSFCLVGWWFPIWKFDWFSTSLLPTTSLNASYMIPYWTLVYEMAFYLVTYAIVLMGARHATSVCLMWLMAILLVSQYVDIDVAQPGAMVLFSKVDVFFIAGMLAALNRDVLLRLPLLPAALGAMFLWVVGDAFGRISMMAHDMTLAASFALLVVLCAPRLSIKPLVWFGDMSFGVYLVHVPFAMLAIHVVTGAHPEIGLGPLWAITFAAAFVGAMAFGMVEHRMYLVLKKAARVRRHAAVIEPVARG